MLCLQSFREGKTGVPLCCIHHVDFLCRKLIGVR